ncbi:MAG: glutamine-hydrolyzing carbamoyl-phosphate synthase small subunit [Nitrococcus sp.]|nr:glutamine-hydrolyzing carbamoyl-phosphate synthase small subunit [Nitrococcus sp.]
MDRPAIIALDDGTVLRGRAIGVEGHAVGEVCFNTALTGYQEICTDPSYVRQLVTLTCAHIGNVGANPLDSESDGVKLAGLLVRDVPPRISSWRARESLQDYLERSNVVAIAGIDTRRLTRHLREQGARNGCIMTGDIDARSAIERARSFPGLQGMDLAKVITTQQAYDWRLGGWSLMHAEGEPPTLGDNELPWRVVAYDYGIKRNILRRLVDHGCRVTVVPATTPAAEALSLRPHGVFLSNGPGDPQACGYAIEAIRELLAAEIPIFGICLGHQFLGLACGARRIKMKFGHHGANHPVLELASGRVLISTQNHGFAVDESTLPKNVQVTYRSLFDGSLQGIHFRDRPAFGFQGHPEASPGPHDLSALFQHFVDLMAAVPPSVRGRYYAADQ